jgi:CheY-like chemotaxis protein
MPIKDGYRTCRDIRDWESAHRYPRTPIIALSANVMADVIDKCAQAGFNKYVTKPVDFRELCDAMMDLLDKTKPHHLMHHTSHYVKPHH